MWLNNDRGKNPVAMVMAAMVMVTQEGRYTMTMACFRFRLYGIPLIVFPCLHSMFTAPQARSGIPLIVFPCLHSVFTATPRQEVTFAFCK